MRPWARPGTSGCSRASTLSVNFCPTQLRDPFFLTHPLTEARAALARKMGTSLSILSKVYSVRPINLPQQVKREWHIPISDDEDQSHHIIQESAHVPRKPSAAPKESTEEIEDPPRWSGNHFQGSTGRYENMSRKQKRAYIRRVGAYQRRPENKHKNQLESKYLYIN
jgi:hypothetical protein